MPQISKAVEDRILARLAHATQGLNAAIAARAATYGIDAFEFDFDSTTYSLFHGDLSWEDVSATGTLVKLPALTIFTPVVSAPAPRMLKGKTFSGTVSTALRLWIQWRKERAERNFSKHANCLEDALVSVLCPIDNAWWSSGVLFNGDISVAKSAIRPNSDTHWLQELTCSLTFECHTN